jgi:hydrogenase maturation protease
VIGYGNDLRGDDGVGPAVADSLGSLLGGRGAVVRSVRQLVPELALDLCTSVQVVFVDAQRSAPAGCVLVRRLDTSAEAPASEPPSCALAFSHGLDAPGLLALAGELYGAAPQAVLVTVGAANLEPGIGLSAAVSSAVPRAAAAVLSAIGDR